MNKLIITAAICGAEVTKAHNPAVPYTIEEVTRESKLAYEAGAVIIHLHVRWDDGTPTQDQGRYKAAMRAIEQACPGIIVLPSTGGAMGMTTEERMQPVELKPEIATIDCGTLNFGGDEIFVNTESMIKAFSKRMRELSVKPECECFDKAMVDTVLRLSAAGWFDAPLHFNFVLGVKGGMAATPQNLVFLTSSIPQGSTWCVTGVGRSQFEMAAQAILLNGHVRVGFEDNVYLEKNQLAASNGVLVEKVVQLANLLGREIASPEEARQMMGLMNRVI